MNRRYRVAAIVVAVLVVLTAGARAQAPKVMAPIYGEAKLQITKPATKMAGNEVTTTFMVKNMESSPIAGLKIDEFWYDLGGTPLGTTTYRHPRPLQPGEVIAITLKTNRVKNLSRNKVGFTHAHGTIKQTVVAKLDAPKT
jgi:uncharacterized protein YcfL